MGQLMVSLSPGVFQLGSSRQLKLDPRLVQIGYWDLPRFGPALSRSVFINRAADELIARLIGLAQIHQQWVAVEWEGFLQQIRAERDLPRQSSEYRDRHLQGDMIQPDPFHAPVYTLAHENGRISDLERAFVTLTGSHWVNTGGRRCAPQISLLPNALNHILRTHG